MVLYENTSFKKSLATLIVAAAWLYDIYIPYRNPF